MTKTNLTETLESFGVTIDRKVQDYIGRCHDPDAMVEWLEKTDGDPELAYRLYGLGEKFPTPDDPEQITPWWDWTHHDPADPGGFTCAGCNTDFTFVEVDPSNHYGSDLLALSERGDLRGYEGVTDPSGRIYNYELEEGYEDTEYTHICTRCRDDFMGRMPRVNVLWYQGPESSVEIRHKSHVAYRPEGFWDLPAADREALETRIKYDGTPEGWVKAYPDRPKKPESAHIRNNIRRWLRSWASVPAFTQERDEYPFSFPAIVQYANRDGTVGGGRLYVPEYGDDRGVEQADEWLSGVAAEYRRGESFAWS